MKKIAKCSENLGLQHDLPKTHGPWIHPCSALPLGCQSPVLNFGLNTKPAWTGPKVQSKVQQNCWIRFGTLNLYTQKIAVNRECHGLPLGYWTATCTCTCWYLYPSPHVFQSKQVQKHDFWTRNEGDMTDLNNSAISHSVLDSFESSWVWLSWPAPIPTLTHTCYLYRFKNPWHSLAVKWVRNLSIAALLHLLLNHFPYLDSIYTRARQKMFKFPYIF